MFLQDERIVLLIFFIMLLVPIAMVILFIIFNNKKNRLIQKREEDRRHFEKELIESQVEIREETLRNIGLELHDNIGQLLTLAKIYVQNAEGDPEKIEESADILGRALDEVRALSKSISPDNIKRTGLLESTQKELERFERLRFLKTNFEVSGEVFPIPEKDEIIMFRIIQEFLSNTIKHARATQIDLKFDYLYKELHITCIDNGIGFSQSEEYSGLGLKNMKVRARLIGANLKLKSTLEKGTRLSINKVFNDEV